MTYIVNIDANARTRLDQQHALYEAHSLSLFKYIDRNMVNDALEAGCGSGVMTQHLSRLLNPSGRGLLSIDIHRIQLEAAAERIKECGVSNVRFKEHDIQKLAALGQTFDLIYCRMVLHHLKNASDAIDQMISALRPGGYLILEEPAIHDGSFCFPEHSGFNRFVKACQLCFEKNKRDYTIAYRMGLEVQQKGMTTLHHSLHHPLLLTEEQKRMYAMAVDDLAPQFIKHNILSQQEIVDLREACVAMSQDNISITWIRMHSLVCQKIP